VNYTPRQLGILHCIERSRRKRGVSPSVRELCRELGGLNVKTVAEHLDRLEEKGAISRERGKRRTLQIADPEIAGTAGRVPLAGTIAAGRPIEAIEECETLDVPASLGFASREGLFALRVKGDSMIEDGILDGDYVVVQKRGMAENGETVVALLEDGTATLKRFYREKRRIRLQPANRSMKPIYARDVAVQGVVKGVLRLCRK